MRLSVCPDTQQRTVEKEMSAKLAASGRLCTDESHAYNYMAEQGHEHRAVCHGESEYGRSGEDGDDFCSGPLQPCDGRHLDGAARLLAPLSRRLEVVLAQYVAVFFELACNHSGRFFALLRAMLLPDFTLANMSHEQIASENHLSVNGKGHLLPGNAVRARRRSRRGCSRHG